MSDLLHINFTPLTASQTYSSCLRLVAVVGEQHKQIYSERSPKIPIFTDHSITSGSIDQGQTSHPEV
ncbi:hypothetical protein PAHAL_5G064900 [Panicum hallii]|jgi:hypothetical protein|uniref:Uncharacterized protein n=1 Tax=Panicum hallii TaxID=206008 RepID=A0A2S3HPG8_9POAL|nr:hypothetical protein PAHAL_5G064900 [Panicum hallii]